MNLSLTMPEGVSTAETRVQALAGGPSVEEALGQGLLKQATLLAGKQGFSRAITGVIPMEVPDTTGWLKGGELVLTTGYLLQEAPERWTTWIEELVKVQAAGLILLASPSIKMLPDAAIETAERNGLPLLVLAAGGTMITIVRGVQEAIAPLAPAV